MRVRSSRYTLIGLLVGLLSACSPQAVPTPRPTLIMSAATLQASPTVQILSAETLYANVTPPGANNAASAGLPSGQYQPPIAAGTRSLSGVQEETIVMADGTMLSADLYVPDSLTRAPAVLLLGSDKLGWDTLPDHLRDRGYNVLVIALPAPTYTVNDFRSVLETMSVTDSIDPAHMAVLAELDAANWALEGCAAVLLCDALAVFSPTSRDRTQAAIGTYAPRPLLIAVASNDAESYPVALSLAGAAQNSTVFVELVSGRGAALVATSESLEFSLMSFLESNLRPVGAPTLP